MNWIISWNINPHKKIGRNEGKKKKRIKHSIARKKVHVIETSMLWYIKFEVIHLEIHLDDVVKRPTSKMGKTNKRDCKMKIAPFYIQFRKKREKKETEMRK